jgi:hypothetical protein
MNAADRTFAAELWPTQGSIENVALLSARQGENGESSTCACSSPSNSESGDPP